MVWLDFPLLQASISPTFAWPYDKGHNYKRHPMASGEASLMAPIMQRWSLLGTSTVYTPLNEAAPFPIFRSANSDSPLKHHDLHGKQQLHRRYRAPLKAILRLMALRLKACILYDELPVCWRELRWQPRCTSRQASLSQMPCHLLGPILQFP